MKKWRYKYVNIIAINLYRLSKQSNSRYCLIYFGLQYNSRNSGPDANISIYIQFVI